MCSIPWLDRLSSSFVEHESVRQRRDVGSVLQVLNQWSPAATVLLGFNVGEMFPVDGGPGMADRVSRLESFGCW